MAINASGYVVGFAHRIVWEAFNGPIPEGYEIHHIDRNPLNNHIPNLQLVSKDEHKEIHRKEFVPCTACGDPERKIMARGMCQRCYFRQRRGSMPHQGWSRKYAQCIACGTTEKKYASNGLCTICYSKYYYRKQDGRYQKRYNERRRAKRAAARQA